ncbi:MAG: hypothetical protein IKQ69_07880 [Oscillospiraceae bacterium]|nr:hypothetical protein [Oscillospiraceae bacterium]
MKLSDLEKKITDAESLRTRLEREQKEAARLADDLKAKADAAAVAGDVAAYRRYKAEADEQEAVAHVRAAQLSKASNPISREDCAAAWSGYRKDYEKSLSSKLAELDKARAAFIKAYTDAVDLQAQACATRERLGVFIGINAADPLSAELDSAFPMLTIPSENGPDVFTLKCPLVGNQDPDLAFVIVNTGSTRLNLATDPAVQRLLTVVRRKRSK